MTEKSENEQDMKHEEITIDQTIESIHKVEGKRVIAMKEAKKLHQITGERCFEYDRLGGALDGATKNLYHFRGKNLEDYPEQVKNLGRICASVEVSLDYDISKMREVRQSMAGMTNISTISTAGTTILNDSTGLYEMNASSFSLPTTPPSVQNNIDPYAVDQPQVEKELHKLLKDIDPELEDHYSGIKEIFKTPQRSRLSATSAEMRQLIWGILRKLAPNEKVASSPGFEQIHKDQGVATYRQQIAYILTGTANINGPEVELINEIFTSLDTALGVFSSKIKALNEVSDNQVITTMARCERVIWSLLRNRKV